MSTSDATLPIDLALHEEERPATWQLFAIIALVQVGTTLLLNRVVLTDEVYRSLLTLAEGGVDQAIQTARRWEIAGYLVNPILLLLRVGFAALLVQLVLLAFRSTPPLREIFRAALWAQTALLLGSALQAGWLALLPPGAINVTTLTAMPGTFGSLLPPLDPEGLPILGILYQLTVFDLGWIAIFILALDEKTGLPIARTTLAVLTGWGIIAIGKWAVLLAMTTLR